MKPITYWELADQATYLAGHAKLNQADRAEAKRLSELRHFSRKDKESLSRLKEKYRL